MVDALVIQTSISGNYLTNNLEIMYFMQKKCNSYDSEFKSLWNSLYFTYFTLIRKNQNNSENRMVDASVIKDLYFRYQTDIPNIIDFIRRRVITLVILNGKLLGLSLYFT